VKAELYVCEFCGPTIYSNTTANIAESVIIIIIIIIMATIEELEVQVKAQGEIVKAAKAADKASDETKAAVAKLLEIKKAITALDPTHPQAIKKKEKKKKKKKRWGETCINEKAIEND
jgi:hypothetical protein